MAERHDHSEIIAEILIQLQSHSPELKQQSEIPTRISDRMERSEAGFNNFALAVLDHLQGIKSELRDVKADVHNLRIEQKRTTTALERFADHEERLRRPEEFMRSAG